MTQSRLLLHLPRQSASDAESLMGIGETLCSQRQGEHSFLLDYPEVTCATKVWWLDWQLMTA